MREQVILDRTSNLNSTAFGSYSCVASYNQHVMLGTLCFYPEHEQGRFDVHYLDKHVTMDTHPLGYLKNEHRKPTKYRILIARLVDRSIRPIIHQNKSFQIVIRLLNSGVGPVGKLAITLASDLLLQAGLIQEKIEVFDYSNGWEYIYCSTYMDRVTMVEACLNEWSPTRIEGFLNPVASKLANSTIYQDKEALSHYPANSSVIWGAIQILKDHYRKPTDKLNRRVQDFLKLYDTKVDVWFSYVFRAFYRSYGRFDGRALDEVRKLTVDFSILKEPFSSVLVTRGGTKVLTSLTVSEEPQSVDEVNVPWTKEFTNVQYDMLGSSVGEVSRMGMHNRREVGHGNLIYNAVKHLRYNQSTSVYVQNDVISCAGSSSMAGVIGTSGAMFVSGTSNKLCAGVTVGTLDKVCHVVDIKEVEDWLGFMDLKVAGTESGLTAIQMDVKNFLPTVDFILKGLSIAMGKIPALVGTIRDSIAQQGVRIEEEYTIPEKKFMVKEDLVKNLIGVKGHNIKKVVELFKVNVDVGKTVRDDNQVEVTVRGKNVGRVTDAVARIHSYLETRKEGVLNAVVLAELRNNSWLVQPDEAISGCIDNCTDVKLYDRIKVSYSHTDKKQRVIYQLVDLK